jgi:hypothetical protein
MLCDDEVACAAAVLVGGATTPTQAGVGRIALGRQPWRAFWAAVSVARFDMLWLRGGGAPGAVDPRARSAAPYAPLPKMVCWCRFCVARQSARAAQAAKLRIVLGRPPCCAVAASSLAAVAAAAQLDVEEGRRVIFDGWVAAACSDVGRAQLPASLGGARARPTHTNTNTNKPKFGGGPRPKGRLTQRAADGRTDGRMDKLW